MSKVINFNIEEYKDKLDKMTESELKDEWDKVVALIRKSFNPVSCGSIKRRYTSSGIKF